MSQESTDSRSETSDQDDTLGVSDDQLPEDLRPSEDNPLAAPAEDDVPEDILKQDAGHARSGADSEDAKPSGDGDASDTSPSTAPSESGSAADDAPGTHA